MNSQPVNAQAIFDELIEQRNLLGNRAAHFASELSKALARAMAAEHELEKLKTERSQVKD